MDDPPTLEMPGYDRTDRATGDASSPTGSARTPRLAPPDDDLPPAIFREDEQDVASVLAAGAALVLIALLLLLIVGGGAAVWRLACDGSAMDAGTTAQPGR